MKNLFLMLMVLGLTSSFQMGPYSNWQVAEMDASLMVKPVGGAYLVFAGKYGGDITRKEMESHTLLSVDGCAHGSRIFKYTLHVKKEGKTYTYQATSNELTTEMQQQFKRLVKGDTFEFSGIKAYLPNGKDVVDVNAERFNVI